VKHATKEKSVEFKAQHGRRVEKASKLVKYIKKIGLFHGI
jgi:hypothetical protein